MDSQDAEDKATRAQKQFMAAIECVSDGFALFDADDRMVFCNSRFKELNPDLAPKIVPGISFEEMLRDNIVTNRILDALGDEEDFIRERMEQHRNPSRPLVQQRRDGRWLELREERTPEGSTLLVNTDITERKRAEDALRDHRDRIRLIADNLPAAIAYFDTEQRYHFVNDTAQKWFARPKENILGRTIEEIVGSEAQEQLSVYLEAALSGKEQRFDLDMTYPDGKTRAVEITYAPHLDASGEVQGCFALVHNITERKRAEEAFHTREAQLRGIMDNAPIEIVLKDTEGHYVLTNAHWQKSYNLTDEEAKGRTLHDFFPEEFAKPLSAHEREVMETGEAAAYEDKFPEPDGVHDFLTITFPIRDMAGEVMNIGVMAVDITERKRAEEAVLMAKEQAELANRTKSQFLANMSHELRTPLNAIIGFSEIIKDEAFGPVGCTKYCDYVNDINESGQHLLDLINDILDLSKIESGAGELQKEVVEIRALVRSIVTLVTGRVKKSSAELEINMPDDVPPLHADSRKLKQILINLLSNAIKFTPAGGKVTLKIWCRVESGYVFQVVDTGIGIALDDIPKALAPFQQVDSELSRKYEGTGLGLPLTKALVEMHGGSLDLQSELGVGTTVTVRFPAESIVHLPGDTQTTGIADRRAS
jgi:PAS domain S-box-containing protein